jgi:predicted phosphodiesterase
MQLAILADIHGNLPALNAVLEDARRAGVDGFVVAGDFLGGPQSQETVSVLCSLNSRMIRGNGEDYFVDFDRGRAPGAWYESHQWSTMRWIYEHLEAESLHYTAALPDQRVVSLKDTDPIRVVHGSPQRSTEQLMPDRDLKVLDVFRVARLLGVDAEPTKLAAALRGVFEPVVVCGHTHIPWRQRENGRLVLNPGSVGAPLNGDPRAQYALLRWDGGAWSVEHRAIPYDLALIRSAYVESGLLAEGGAIAKAGLLGIETGQNVIGAFLDHTYALAAESGCEGGTVVPDGIWHEAVGTFDW